MNKCCNRCKKTKDVSCFSKRNLKTGTTSYNHWCKQCHKEDGARKTLLKYCDIKVDDLPEEAWYPLLDYNGYLISNKHRIKSLPKSNRPCEFIVTPTLQKTGYYSVPLYLPSNDRKFKRISVHRIIAKMFIPNVCNKPCVNHINHDRSDNRIENLEWCTHKENLEHAKKFKRMQHGEARYNNALTEKQVLDIFSSKEAQRPLAKKYNVHQGTIAKIRTGQNWSYLTGKVYDNKCNKS
jgi:hypothetical protein